MRAVREPGGVLLIGVGMADDEVHAALAALYPRAASITVLIDTQQQKQKWQADEIWVYGPLGLRGALALIRRISWRHFTAVVQPNRIRLRHLRLFIWPRPVWFDEMNTALGATISD